ncbi:MULTISPECIES: RluA family pseudouridine synthase [unclassified Streptococcus]|uniref:RluA family pseudouridine synthase n=1 Tax=unclassified Streptococcus TaxID=2608887 RepID=UPI0018ABF56E|nr:MULTISPECIES: RluA family pseudouridine synthase [unclassified Streptococcus]MBF8969876.1 RluA family pseudouridine synthase [Streptococcus sp. NLN76]MBG9366903.1 RluA family pseudouridine synthase [Streptococcus sp. NLN64]
MKINITIPAAWTGLTIKQVLEEKLLIPRKIRHFLRMEKALTLDGQAVHWQIPVETGQVLDLDFKENWYEDRQVQPGQADQIKVLYEDEHLIVVQKPEGMKTHANQPGEIACLNHVVAHTGQTCYVVHRLDQETSGLLLFAKNPVILPLLNRLLENRKIKREYWALVEGTFARKEQVYRDMIGRDRHDRRKRRVDSKKGQRAQTTIRVLKSNGDRTLVACQLATGRTHQIRVHLSHHGHPLVGDPLYHPHPEGRLLLHAHRLSFVHPLTQESLVLQATSPSFEAGITFALNR